MCWLTRVVIIMLISGLWNRTTWSVDSKKITLFDSTKQRNLSWVHHSDSIRTEDGWQEESFTDQGVNWRSYVVCDVFSEHVNNWLWTPYIVVASAQRVYIEIMFTNRDCKQFPHTALTCKETFSMYYAESDYDLLAADASKSPKDYRSSFRLIDRIAADKGRFTSKQNVPRSRDVQSIPVTRRGLYLAFHDEGACLSILYIKIYYTVCEEHDKSSMLAKFEETPTGRKLSSIRRVLGQCFPNAVSRRTDPPTRLCTAEGTWDMTSGGCDCEPGFENIDQQCSACNAGYFQPLQSLSLCQKCPHFSAANETGTRRCHCLPGYFRAAIDNASTPCTKPPSAPTSLSIEHVDQTSITLSWSPSQSLGGRSDLHYRVKCPQCDHTTKYEPATAKNLTSSTRVKISNLESGVEYAVYVVAENGVSELDKEGMDSRTASVSIETAERIPYPAKKVRSKFDAEQRYISLEWDGPSISYGEMIDTLQGDFNRNSSQDNSVSDIDSHRLIPVDGYMVRYSVGNTINLTKIFVTQPRLVIEDVPVEVQFRVQVKSLFNRFGWSSWSDPHWTELTRSSDFTTNLSVIVSLCGFASLLFVIFAIVCVACFMRRTRLPSKCKNRFSGQHGMRLNLCSNIRREAKVDTVLRKYASSDGSSSASTNSTKVRKYVDPLTYEDPSEALKAFTHEIPSDSVEIDNVIGAGEFGEVCCGKLKLKGIKTETVAIKTLKPGSTKQARSDFLREASIMGQFCHPNIIKLRGVVTIAEPIMIITEYMDHHSLDNFLKEDDTNLEVLHLIHILHEVASGMSYLSDIGFIHRDLAARNVLINRKLNCKIADFGLSRLTNETPDQIYVAQGGKIPVRWTAPEAIAYRKFTISSDVWSFGIVMWEVMSQGERPYWDWTNHEVIQAVNAGYRLPKPKDCPGPVYNAMLLCWTTNYKHRPTFAQLRQTFADFMRCPELLVPAREDSPTDTSDRYDSEQDGSMLTIPATTTISNCGSSTSYSALGDHHCNSGGKPDYWCQRQTGFKQADYSGTEYGALKKPIFGPSRPCGKKNIYAPFHTSTPKGPTAMNGTRPDQLLAGEGQSDSVRPQYNDGNLGNIHFGNQDSIYGYDNCTNYKRQSIGSKTSTNNANDLPIDAFLSYIHLAQFIPAFTDAGLCRLSDLNAMWLQNLAVLGMTRQEDHQTLIRGIAMFKRTTWHAHAETDVNMPQQYLIPAPNPALSQQHSTEPTLPQSRYDGCYRQFNEGVSNEMHRGDDNTFQMHCSSNQNYGKFPVDTQNNNNYQGRAASTSQIQPDVALDAAQERFRMRMREDIYVKRAALQNYCSSMIQVPGTEMANVSTTVQNSGQPINLFNPPPAPNGSCYTGGATDAERDVYPTTYRGYKI